MAENKYTNEDLKTMQAWSLQRKIQVTQTRIMEWYMKHNGKVYVSFSGGKDSTVLLDLTRRIYPDVEAVFVDTGLEYPEIREFVKTFDNVTWLRPEMNFRKVIEKYGYPVISKEISRDISAAKNKPNGKTAEKFNPNSNYSKKYGKRWCLEKYRYLIDSPFKISNQCCNIMKKKPLKKIKNKYPIIGTMASESNLRKKEWLKSGCNAFDKKYPSSQPMSFWTEQDVFNYIKQFNINICSVYGEIILDKNNKFITTKCDRTGCMFCMYGAQCDKSPNRFERMKITHPKQYEYCMKDWDKGGLGLAKVLDYIGIKH
jgi:3'-phosphoadenosine 5'-phosphosulfate sulfotransferase (PAPS reductase)/FAD synthetase